MSVTAADSFAVVSASGNLVRGADATGANRVGTGRFTVSFNHTVNKCGYVASIGSKDNAKPPAGVAAVAIQSNSKVYVETRNLAGILDSLPFHLVVIC
jgi:hypothetical protein